MPKQQAEDSHAKAVQRLLHARDFGHLRARRYGATVIIESGPDGDVYKHMRLTRDGVHVWVLHFADRNGRWEPTPFRGQLEELVTLVADTFPWTLQDVHGFPERTSDRKH
ncbi:MAG TPA: hypothetical protein VHG72_19720 [Polyangia bacterium]|nr:hypothetical protein [Polyangia bacterium]